MIELAVALVILAQMVVLYAFFHDKRHENHLETYNRGFDDGVKTMARQGYKTLDEFEKENGLTSAGTDSAH